MVTSRADLGIVAHLMFPVIRKLRQGEQFKASLGYTIKPFKNKQTNKVTMPCDRNTNSELVAIIPLRLLPPEPLTKSSACKHMPCPDSISTWESRKTLGKQGW